MNFTRSQHFFFLVVKPTVKDFLDSPGDIRKACLAAIVLNHLTDYWVVENLQSPNRCPSKDEMDKAIKYLSALCPDFNLIHDVADASKHAELRNDTREPHSSNQLNRDPGLFEAPFGQALFAEAIRAFILFPDGTRKYLESAVGSVFKMWESQLGL
jgi:hypothetical protein